MGDSDRSDKPARKPRGETKFDIIRKKTTGLYTPEDKAEMIAITNDHLRKSMARQAMAGNVNATAHTVCTFDANGKWVPPADDVSNMCDEDLHHAIKRFVDNILDVDDTGTLPEAWGDTSAADYDGDDDDYWDKPRQTLPLPGLFERRPVDFPSSALSPFDVRHEERQRYDQKHLKWF